jgi:hypothetical protein
VSVQHKASDRQTDRERQTERETDRERGREVEGNLTQASSSCLTRLPLRVLAEMDPSRGFMRLPVSFFTSH